MAQATPTDRFWAKVAKSDDCWLWTGATQTNGYGSLTNGRGGSVLAHRYVYEMFVGPIPDGLTIDHLCHNRDRTCAGGKTCAHRRCVRPGHLEAVTGAENVRRALGADEDQCRAGHPATPQNVRYRRLQSGTVRRVCLVCQRVYNRRWQAKTPRSTRG